MIDNALINVLWIEQDQFLIEDYVEQAEQYGLRLVAFDCWDTAKVELMDNLDKWQAIILEANSKLHKGSYRNAMQFLPQVFCDIYIANEKKGKLIPWYILSKCKPETFQDLILETRREFDQNWGLSYYIKGKHQKELFQRIKDQTQLADVQAVRSGIQKDVFVAIEELKDYGLAEEVDHYLEQLLLTLYFGKEIANPFAPVRKIIEAVFHSMVKVEMLPYILGKTNTLNIKGCCRLLSNLPVNTDDFEYKPQYRVFPVILGNNVRTMLDVSNSGMHAGGEDKQELQIYNRQIGVQNIVSSFALQLCDLILWYYKQIKDYNAHFPQWWEEFRTIEI